MEFFTLIKADTRREGMLANPEQPRARRRVMLNLSEIAGIQDAKLASAGSLEERDGSLRRWDKFSYETSLIIKIVPTFEMWENFLKFLFLVREMLVSFPISLKFGYNYSKFFKNRL